MEIPSLREPSSAFTGHRGSFMNEGNSVLTHHRSPIVSARLWPLEYSLPSTFSIGHKDTPHLVNVAQMKGHLALLNAFTSLQSYIRGLSWLPVDSEKAIQNMPCNQDTRWVWFVSVAVERFQRWCETLSVNDLSRPVIEFLPPIDVLMVWHAYLLNPGWYAEDCVRLPIMQYLTKASEIFASSLGSDLEEIITAEPTEARHTFWTLKTGRSWDALENVDGEWLKEFPCPNPKCKKLIRIDYMNAKGNGYFQRKFQIRCEEPACNMRTSNGYPVYIDKDMLRARKFLDDLFREGEGLQAYMAGSIRTPYMNIDIEQGERIKRVIHEAMVLHHVGLRPVGTPADQWENIILQKTLCQFNDLQTSVMLHVHELEKPLIERVFSAYSHPGPFSVDLVGAIIRQSSFTEKMVKLEWTKPNHFQVRDDEIPLLHAIARYHAFLDLMAENPRSFNVPTLDIDLAWHTHQLMGHKYNLDCKEHVSRYVDHHDNVDEASLSNSFAATAAFWQERFGLDYVHCGCPVPGKTISQRITDFFIMASSSPSPPGTSPPYLRPPGHPDLLASTHPSDHNSIISIPENPSDRTALIAERETRRNKLHNFRGNSSLPKTREGALVPQNLRDHIFPPAFLMPLSSLSGNADCAATSGRLQSSYGMAACAPAYLLAPPNLSSGNQDGVSGSGGEGANSVVGQMLGSLSNLWSNSMSTGASTTTTTTTTISRPPNTAGGTDSGRTESYRMRPLSNRTSAGAFTTPTTGGTDSGPIQSSFRIAAQVPSVNSASNSDGV